jgi:alkylation response protein AidB-like acyl-CoA dehydrogenase
VSVSAAPARLADPAAALAAARALVPALAARAAEHDAADVFPATDFADLRAAGLLGLMVPPRLGGPGAGFADYAAVRARVGRAEARVEAARLAVLETARRVDAAPGDRETNRWVWRAKLLAGETAMDVAASMPEAAGTSATRRGSPLERIFRNARCGSLQPATSDVCADRLGAAALGDDPEAGGRW